MWELRCARDNFSIEAAVEKGRQLPQWYLEEPPLLAGDSFYLRAFRDLHTCRLSQGISIGSIPWSSVLTYAQIHGLESDLIEPFIHIIRSMDIAYQEWIMREQERIREK